MLHPEGRDDTEDRNQQQEKCKDIPLRPDEIVWSDVHRIEVRYQ